MLMSLSAVLIVFAQPAAIAPECASESADVGYEALAQGQNERAQREIEANPDLDKNDPSRLINLGIAYARQGDEAKAREMFEAALQSSDRAWLETANGEWVDSRHLARKATRMLERGEFSSTNVAMR